MTKFLEIDIEGFGSIVKPTNFKLDRGNVLSVITGRVGHGKTTIVNSLVWVLYGKSLKDKASINTLEEYQSDKYRGTKVSVKIDTDQGLIEIIRCKSFKGNISIGGKKVKGGNNIFVLLDGKIYDSDKGKGKINNQLIINKILGYSFELFKNAVVFGQKMKKLIQESGPDKKKIFEEAFDMLFIEEAKDHVNEEKKKILSLVNKFEKEIDIIGERINKREKLHDKAIDHEKFFMKYQEKDIKHYEEKILENLKRIKSLKGGKDYQSKLDELHKTKSSLLKEIGKIKSHNAIYLNLESTIKDYQKEYNELRAISSKGFERCPTCGTPIKEKIRKTYIESTKDKQEEIKKNLKTLQHQFMEIEHKDISKKEKQLKETEISIGVIEQRIKDSTKNSKEILRLEKSNKESEEEINLIKDEKLIIRSTFYEKLANKLIRKKKIHIRTLGNLKEQLEILNWLLNDPLSNNGLKAYLFNNFLDSVNDKLVEYSKLLGFTIEFGIDLKSHRKDFYQLIEREGVIIPYEDLSGGQQQLLDTSLAFAINDVISELKPLNILFLDEPFESLGVEEIEIISELIYEKSKTKSVYLITHHQSFSTTNAETIYVKLDKNKNTIIDG